MLAVDYLRQDDKRGAMECMNNIYLSKTKAIPETNSFQNLIQLQKTWKNLMEYFSSEKVRQEVCRQLSISV
jgi:phage terminase large subunit